MTITLDQDEVMKYARIAGFAYLVTIFLGIFSVNFVLAEIIVPGDNSATLRNIVAEESLFRLGVACEILMYVLVVLLAHSLFVVLRSVDRNLALLALLWRLAEAIVGSAATVVSGLLPLLLLTSDGGVPPGQIGGLVISLLDLRPAALDVVLIFIGMGGTIFCYLFFRSSYIPRLLAAWGIVTYLTMLLLSFASLITPITESTRMLFYAPGGLFEIIIGFWLLVKGVNVPDSQTS